MSLIIETGLGIIDADSFVTLEDARLLAVKYGLTIATNDIDAEVQLRKGYQGLLVSERLLQGKRTFDVQTGIFPRVNVISNCAAVDSNAIPSSVILAQLYFADAVNSGAETNGVNDGNDLASFNVQGVYSETYQSTASKKLNATIQGVTNTLYALTKEGLASSPCGAGGGIYREELGQEWL